MRAERKSLSASNIRYLLTMKALVRKGGGVRCVDLANALGHTKPSVHNMTDTLIRMGLVRRSAYGNSFFTDTGLELAERYAGYYEAVSGLISGSFPGLDSPETAVYSLLAEIPEDKLKKFSGS